MAKLIYKDWAVLSPDDRILHTFGSYDLAEAWFIQRDGWTMGLQLVRLRTTKEVYEVSRPDSVSIKGCRAEYVGPGVRISGNVVQSSSQGFDPGYDHDDFTIPDMPQEVRA